MQVSEVLRVKGNTLFTVTPETMLSDCVITMAEHDIGAYPDFLHVGEFKTAVNQMTEKGYTPQHREMSESLNRDMYDQLVRGIAEARKKSEQEVRALIDRGPFIADEAVREGLVDELA